MDVVSRFKTVITYWNAIRDGRKVPYRTAFNPAKVQPWLSRLMIVKRDEDGVFCIRLSGTEIAQRVGYELTNETFRTLSQLDESEAIEHQRLFHGILDQPMAGFGCREWLTNKGPYNCYFMSLPFLDKNGEANMFFIVGEFSKSLAELAGSEFVQFGKLTEFTTLDIGFGISSDFDMYPSESMDDLLAPIMAEQETPA